MASASPSAKTLLAAVLVSLFLGFAVTVALAIPMISAILYAKRHVSPLVSGFWCASYHGFFIGLGVAVGYTILNWVIGTTDRTKNCLGN